MEQSLENKQIITNQEFKAMGAEWTALDTEYDNLFQTFLDNPDIKKPEELLKFKSMQQRLYAIELKLYKVAEGEMIIQN